MNISRPIGPGLLLMLIMSAHMAPFRIRFICDLGLFDGISTVEAVGNSCGLTKEKH